MIPKEQVPQIGERVVINPLVAHQKITVAEDSGDVRVVINTPALDAYDRRILPSGADLSGYALNPQVWINHDIDKPVGRSTVTYDRENDRLVAVQKYDDWHHEDPLAALWYSKVKAGFVVTASIGGTVKDVKWVPRTGSDDPNDEVMVVTSWELNEWSWTPLPANREAVLLTEAMRQHGQNAALDKLLVELAAVVKDLRSAGTGGIAESKAARAADAGGATDFQGRVDTVIVETIGHLSRQGALTDEFLKTLHERHGKF